MAVHPDRIVSVFLELVVIDAVSFHEGPVAAFIKRGAGRSFRFIDCGIPPGGTCPNLLCVPRSVDVEKPVCIICAHMDTVGSTKDLNPVVEAGRIHTGGKTILGADNRAGVAALLFAMREIDENRLNPANCVFLFTAAEETGTMGSKNVEWSSIPGAASALVFDCSKRPGVFIQHCYGCVGFTVAIRGRAAHAGIHPESGINAIAIASDIIHRLPQGRLPDGVLMNIGMIQGGEATNVVPPAVVFRGEVRGPDRETIEYRLQRIRETVAEAAKDRGATSEITTAESFVPFVVEEALPVYREAVRILQRAGLKPEPIVYTGGSDANSFNERGIPAINFGIGAQQPHSVDEFILIEDLLKSAEMVMYAAEETAQ